MSYVWITEKQRRDAERQEREAGKAIADFIRRVIIRKGPAP